MIVLEATIVILLALVYVFLFPITFPLSIALIIYCAYYFRSANFKELKSRIQSYIDDSNALNAHIESLKLTSLPDNRTDTGDAKYVDTSKWNKENSRPMFTNALPVFATERERIRSNMCASISGFPQRTKACLKSKLY